MAVWNPDSYVYFKDMNAYGVSYSQCWAFKPGYCVPEPSAITKLWLHPEGANLNGFFS
ncbi:hypothetical protein I79_005265 [Cricetulus griseus]|uniref:Uncharacterized protein n=1 Tax=Cricetulus griseus TaxID=10029 RepID=G3H4Q8_CRIGR|nr:hypothetical protein I79_005265 [Cricetulus griseus]